MQFLEGQRLPLWIASLKGRGRKARVKATVKSKIQDDLPWNEHFCDGPRTSRVQSGPRDALLHMDLTVAFTRAFLPTLQARDP